VLLDAVTELPAQIDPHTRSVLERLTAPTRVGDLVAVSCIPEYDVYEILFNAIDAGIVRILEVPAEPIPEPEAVAAAFVDEDPVSISGAVMWVLAVCMLFLCAGGGWMGAAHWRSHPDAVTNAIHTDRARHDLASGLETYRALMGRYPAQLDELASDGLVPETTIAAAGVRSYTSRGRDRFTLDYLPAAP
jgi:hypothetical protein